MFGAKGDGTTDDSNAFQLALDTKMKMQIPDGTYKITKTLKAYNSIYFEKDANIEFYPSAGNIVAISLSGTQQTLLNNVECVLTDRTMTFLDTVPDLQKGDWVRLSNSEKVSIHARDYDTKRDILQVQEVIGSNITFVSTPYWEYSIVTVQKLNQLSDIIIDGAKIKCMEKLSSTYGLYVNYCRNISVSNCNIKNFDYGQITMLESVLCNISNNFCEIDYREQLQYGIVLNSCFNCNICGNSVLSARTAIDVSRVSQKVTVDGNSVYGNINTHSSVNIIISNNTINNGMILIRGKDSIVTGNIVENYIITCFDIQEMGLEGGHIISNNIFIGYIYFRWHPTNNKFINNTLKVKKALEYEMNGINISSVIRLQSHSDGSLLPTSQYEISGNTIVYEGDTPPTYCIEGQSIQSVTNDLIIKNNIIKNFKTAIYIPQTSATLGKNIYVNGNILEVTERGIVFRLENNTHIEDNTIHGRLAKGQYGIFRFDTNNIDTNGLFIKNNFIRNFSIGLQINGTGRLYDAVVKDNIYMDVDTKEVGIQRLYNNPERYYIESSSGQKFQIQVSDEGVLSTIKLN